MNSKVIAEVLKSSFQVGFLPVVLLASALPQNAFALISACNAPPPSNQISTIAAAGGCAYVDASFQNLVVTPGPNSGGFAAQSGTNNDLSVTGNTSTINAIFSADGTNWANNGNGNQSTSATINYSVTAHSDNTAYPGGGGTYSAAPAGQVWDFSTITLNPTGTLSSQTSLSVQMQVCLNTTTLAGCAAAATITATFGSGTNNISSYACSVAIGFAGACNATGDQLILSAQHPTVIAISDTYTISVNNNGSHPVSLSTIGNSFGQISETQAPEPGTLSLLGGSLLGLAALARRRRA